jgi:hypothetical protein
MASLNGRPIYQSKQAAFQRRLTTNIFCYCTFFYLFFFILIFNYDDNLQNVIRPLFEKKKEKKLLHYIVSRTEQSILSIIIIIIMVQKTTNLIQQPLVDRCNDDDEGGDHTDDDDDDDDVDNSITADYEKRRRVITNDGDSDDGDLLRERRQGYEDSADDDRRQDYHDRDDSVVEERQTPTGAASATTATTATSASMCAGIPPAITNNMTTLTKFVQELAQQSATSWKETTTPSCGTTTTSNGHSIDGYTKWGIPISIAGGNKETALLQRLIWVRYRHYRYWWPAILYKGGYKEILENAPYVWNHQLSLLQRLRITKLLVFDGPSNSSYYAPVARLLGRPGCELMELPSSLCVDLGVNTKYEYSPQGLIPITSDFYTELPKVLPVSTCNIDYFESSDFDLYYDFHKALDDTEKLLKDCLHISMPLLDLPASQVTTKWSSSSWVNRARYAERLKWEEHKRYVGCLLCICGPTPNPMSTSDSSNHKQRNTKKVVVVDADENKKKDKSKKNTKKKNEKVVGTKKIRKDRRKVQSLTTKSSEYHTQTKIMAMEE